jgi:hypothetical protein
MHIACDLPRSFQQKFEWQFKQLDEQDVKRITDFMRDKVSLSTQMRDLS